MKSKMKLCTCRSITICMRTPRKDMTLGEVHPSKLMWMRPGYAWCTVNKDSRIDPISTDPKNLADIDTGYTMNFLDITRDRGGRWNFDTGIQHLKHFLEWRVFNYQERTMASSNPANNQISEFCFVVWWSMSKGIDCLFIGCTLSLTDCDMINEVAGGGVMMSANNRFCWISK